MPPTAPPGTTVGYQDSDWTIRMTMQWSPGELVTGTKVECGFMLFVQSNWQLRANPPKPAYASVVVDKVRFHVGDGNDALLPEITPTSSPVALPLRRVVPYDPDDPDNRWWQEQPPVYVYYPRFRFASTRFPDGASIPVWAEVDVTLANKDGTHKDVTVVSPLYTFTAYDKGLTLATKQWYDIKKKVYTTEETPSFKYYDWTSRNAVEGVTKADGSRDATGSAYDTLVKARHTVLDPPDGILPNDGVLGYLGSMTTFLGFTHGEKACLLGSCVPGAPTDAAKLYYNGGAKSQVGIATWHDPADRTKPRKAPRPNLVVLHACSGLQEGYALGQAFGILKPGQIFDEGANKVREGRAYAGFTDVVDTALTFDHSPAPAKPHFLEDHAKLIYQHLLEGWTIGKAVENANSTYKPRGLRLNGTGDIESFAMDMLVKVDPYTRLLGVYRDEDYAVYKNPDNSLVWNLILPPIPWTEPPAWWLEGQNSPPSDPPSSNP